MPYLSIKWLQPILLCLLQPLLTVGPRSDGKGFGGRRLWAVVGSNLRYGLCSNVQKEKTERKEK